MRVWDLAAPGGGNRRAASGPVVPIPPAAASLGADVDRRYETALARCAPLLRSVAARTPPGVDADDVVQECRIALLKVVLAADPRRGSLLALARRALPRVAILVYRRALGPARAPRAPGGGSGPMLPAYLSTTDPGVADDDAPCPEAEAVRREEGRMVHRRCAAARAGMGPVDRAVLDALLSGGGGWRGSGLTRRRYGASVRRIRARFRGAGP